jgi:hypothetical protein
VRLTSPVASDQAPTTPVSLLVRRQGGQVAGRIEVPAGGRFRLVEPPGVYRLVLAGVEGCQATLRLVAGAPARVTLSCDPVQAAGGPAGVVRSAAVPTTCPPMLQAYDAGRAVGLSSCAGEVGLTPVATLRARPGQELVAVGALAQLFSGPVASNDPAVARLAVETPTEAVVEARQPGTALLVGASAFCQGRTDERCPVARVVVSG